MSMRWISEVPSKMVKILALRSSARPGTRGCSVAAEELDRLLGDPDRHPAGAVDDFVVVVSASGYSAWDWPSVSDLAALQARRYTDATAG